MLPKDCTSVIFPNYQSYFSIHCSIHKYECFYYHSPLILHIVKVCYYFTLLLERSISIYSGTNATAGMFCQNGDIFWVTIWSKDSNQRNEGKICNIIWNMTWDFLRLLLFTSDLVFCSLCESLCFRHLWPIILTFNMTNAFENKNSRVEQENQ